VIDKEAFRTYHISDPPTTELEPDVRGLSDMVNGAGECCQYALGGGRIAGYERLRGRDVDREPESL
jgi:hypothetical protein